MYFKSDICVSIFGALSSTSIDSSIPVGRNSEVEVM